MTVSRIWVYAEATDGNVATTTLELLAKANELADTVECVTAAGADVATELGAHGATKVYTVGGTDGKLVGPTVAGAIAAAVEGGNAPDEGEVGKLIAGITGEPVPDIVWDGVTRIPEWFSWVSAGNRVYIKEAEDTTFASLKMISQLLLPWSSSPNRDIADHAGSLPEPAPVKLAQEAGS